MFSIIHPMSRFGFLFGLILTAVLATSSAKADGKDVTRSRPYVNQLYVSLTPSDMGQVEAIRTSASAVLAPNEPAVVEHHVAIDPAALTALRNAGIAARVLDSDFQRLVDESYARWLTPSLMGYSGTLPTWFNQAQPLDAVYSYLDELAKSAPERASVRTVGKAYKNAIKVIRISSAATDGNRGSVLVTGTYHAREWLSPMVVMGYAWNLVEQYASDPVVKKVVDNLNIYIIPVENPDGYVLSFNGDRMRRTNQSPSCASGVDLNRNWPSKDWGKNVGSCGQETYPGPKATSEPETQVTKALGDSLSNLRLYLDIHSPGNAVLTPYAANYDRPKMYDEIKAAADTYGSLAGLKTDAAVITAQASGGGALDYFQEIWDNKRGMAIAVELPPGLFYEFDIPLDGIPTNVDKNIKGFMAVLDNIADKNPASTGTAGAGGSGSADGAAGAAASAAGQSGGGSSGANAFTGTGGTPSMGGAGGSTGSTEAGAIPVGGSDGLVPVMGGSSGTIMPSLSGAAGQMGGDAVLVMKQSRHGTFDCSAVAVGSDGPSGKLALALTALALVLQSRRRRKQRR
jgi:MYXO-CTERM domain-containing protein